MTCADALRGELAHPLELAADLVVRVRSDARTATCRPEPMRPSRVHAEIVYCADATSVACGEGGDVVAAVLEVPDATRGWAATRLSTPSFPLGPEHVRIQISDRTGVRVDRELRPSYHTAAARCDLGCQGADETIDVD